VDRGARKTLHYLAHVGSRTLFRRAHFKFIPQTKLQSLDVKWWPWRLDWQDRGLTKCRPEFRRN
jgi:hypothetical protein